MFKFFKSMTWFIKKNWYRYVLVFFFGILGTALNLLPTFIVGRLTDRITLGTVTFDFLIYETLIPFLIVCFAIYGNALLRRTCMNFLTTKAYYALHRRYIDSIMAEDASFFERFQSGDLLVRAIGDINTVKFSVGNRVINIIVEAFNVIGAFVMMVLINPILAVSTFIPLSLIIVFNILFKGKVMRNWKQVREESSMMGNAVLESITNVRTIRAYNKEEDSLKKNLLYSERTYVAEYNNLKVNVIFEPLFTLIVGLSTFICFALGAYFYFSGNLTNGASDLVKFSMYLGLFQKPLTMIGDLITKFYQSLISADRLNEVYNSKSSVIDKNNLSLDKIEEIEFRNFSFKYPQDNYYVLHSINLTIKKGETVGIVGKTGAGKSTLSRQLARQLPIDDNTIFINGTPIEEYDKKEIRKHVSYVPQEHVLFSRSVYDNVSLGDKNPTREMVDKAIELADFKKDLSSLSDGLDTIVGEYGVTLSGGQKQRLGIARALLNNSDVLVLDDSLSAVDGKTEANIINTLKTYRADKTNIIVCHRLSAVKHANKIIVLDDGKIVESGTHEDLIKNQGWYYEQFISQKMEVEL
ncbi:MAG: ABC transporter ATP-binding protein [Acholeplasmatales bacterium]|nr:ABC transporter ATP-binding protein [Acholeplasmatales bacterium]